jgi:hypothetical protein
VTPSEHTIPQQVAGLMPKRGTRKNKKRPFGLQKMNTGGRISILMQRRRPKQAVFANSQGCCEKGTQGALLLGGASFEFPRSLQPPFSGEICHGRISGDFLFCSAGITAGSHHAFAD